jgi:transposase
MESYHKRSNVETTFSMIKAKFGDGLRSKTITAQKNEALCKVLAHNLCCVIQSIYELGIEPTFWNGNSQ